MRMKKRKRESIRVEDMNLLKGFMVTVVVCVFVLDYHLIGYESWGLG